MEAFGLTPLDAPTAVVHQTHPVDRKYVMKNGKSGSQGRERRAELSEESIKSMVGRGSMISGP